MVPAPLPRLRLSRKPAARLSHDINHVRRVLDQLVHQIEQSAYRALEKAEDALARLVRREGAATPRALRKLEWRMADPYHAQEAAIDLAERVRLAVEQAHGALNIVNPSTGRVNTVAAAQATLLEVAEQLREVERQRYVEILEEIASEHQVAWPVVEAAARLWELDKQHRAANWSGTREQ